MSEAGPPLWKVMHDAFWKAAGFEKKQIIPSQSDAECYAAELRAIAEEIEKRWSSNYIDDIPGEIASWLRAEADRAEAEN